MAFMWVDVQATKGVRRNRERETEVRWGSSAQLRRQSSRAVARVETILARGAFSRREQRKNHSHQITRLSTPYMTLHQPFTSPVRRGQLSYCIDCLREEQAPTDWVADSAFTANMRGKGFGMCDLCMI